MSSYKVIRTSSLTILLMVFYSTPLIFAQDQMFFRPPQNLSNSAAYSDCPAITTGPTGNPAVVWTDFSSRFSSDVFFGASNDSGATFTSAQNISNNAIESGCAQVAIDYAGNINMVWGDLAPGNLNIFYRRSSDGGATFSIPIELSTTTNISWEPQIALDDLGNISVVWPDSQGIFFTRSIDGGVSFATPQQISNGGVTTNARPQLNVDSSGKIVVVWHEGNNLFFTQSADGGQTFAVPIVVSSAFSAVKLAVDVTGNIHVVWYDFSMTLGGQSDIFYSRSVDGGQSFAVPQNISNTSMRSLFPLIAVDSVGNVYVAWNESANFGTIVFTRSSDGGATFSAPFALSAGHQSQCHDLVVDTLGNINVAWSGARPDVFGTDVIFTRSTDGGTSFSVPRGLVPFTSVGFCPKLALDSADNVHMVWRKSVGPGFNDEDIFYSRSYVPTITDLIHLVTSLALPHGTETSLLSKLHAANAALERNSGVNTACNLLNAFVAEVQAQSGISLTTAQATQLVRTANAVRNDLGCS